jgi:signal transduction histidine kinase/putative methionine-R-sulfoxide reductase with GAF domain
MEMFVLDEEVARLETELPLLHGAIRMALLMPLCWHLRQRNTQRALALADEAEMILLRWQMPEPEEQCIKARLLLVRSEVKWLAADLETAEQLGLSALAQFINHDDQAGAADAHWLLAWIAGDHGHTAARDAGLEEAAAHAHEAADNMRIDIIESALARLSIWRHVRANQAHWGERFHNQMADLHPAIGGWVNDYLGAVAFQSNDFGHAAACRTHTYEMALETGQIQRAIYAATNIGASFAHLNDHFAALEWKQRGLDLALPTGWPGSIGLCLIQTAESLRLLGRLDTAHELLAKARHTLLPLSDSRSYTLALRNLGDLALDQGAFIEAIEAFRQLEERADTLHQTDFQAAARRGQAHALSYLDRPREALQKACNALEMARGDGNASQQIASLRVLAEIHTLHPLVALDIEPSASGNLALHYLQQALEVAERIEGYTTPDDLLDAIADAYNAAGQPAAAFTFARKAWNTRKKTHSQETINHAISLQVRHETERERAEGEHHRKMAHSEARRAEALQQTSQVLKRLDIIGQEITAHLDLFAVFNSLNRHLNGLLDASHFAVYLLDHDGFSLNLTFGVEEGQALPPTRIDLSQDEAVEVRCVRERREIFLDRSSTGDCSPHFDSSPPMLSRLFAPLAIGDQILGIMTIQSSRINTYGEREQLIFRTLCAYGAIAFDNASAYRHLEATLNTLRTTQSELVDAMQVKYESERAQAENKHHRQLAASEAQRAEVLHQTSATLEHLSAIGQEITAQLDASVVYQSLNRHVCGLLNAHTFCIYLLDHDALLLHCVFNGDTEAGQRAAIAIDDPHAASARCVRLRHEILIDHPVGAAPSEAAATAIHCTPALCKLYSPLAIGNRILGVLSVQSDREQAFGDRERLIFRTLCGYGAIALDNANAYRQLQQAQAQLVGHEKLAALGALVAGVAHELNTPIGNSLMMASSLQEKTEIIEQKMRSQSLLQQDLAEFLIDAQEASSLIMRGLSSAADLVSSFKQVAVDRTTARRRPYELEQTSHEIIATMMSQIRQSGHSIDINIPNDIYLDGYPGPFGQIITNFINNALLHAFSGRTGGRMHLSATSHDKDRVLILFRDDGTGILEQNLRQIFEPFFTTKRDEGGSGLGLSIIYNIVTTLLNGKISVESAVGKGTTFTLDLPLIAPNQEH